MYKNKIRIQRQIAIEQLDNYMLKQSTCQRLKWSYQLHLIAHKKALRLAKSQIQLQPKDIVEQVMQMVEEKRIIGHVQNKQKDNNHNHNHNSNKDEQGIQYIIDQQYYLTYYGVIDPKQLVSTLLIDDGFQNREHRKALLNKRMNHIGIGIHQHPTKYFVVVIIMANHVKLLDRGSNLSEAPPCQCQIV